MIAISSHADLELDDVHDDRADDARPSPGKCTLTARLWPQQGRVYRAALDRDAGPRAPDGVHGPDPFAVHLVDRAAASSGTPLPTELRAPLERSLDADLSSVRVHTGAESAASSQALAARAYTIGQDVHFGAGNYDPSSASGRHLIAHEVAHTVQQRGAAPAVQERLEVSQPGDAHEVEAEAFADAFAAGRATPVRPVAGGVVARSIIQRDPDGGAKKAPLVQPNSPSGPAATSGDSAKDAKAGAPSSGDKNELDLGAFAESRLHPTVAKAIGDSDDRKKAFLVGMRGMFGSTIEKKPPFHNNPVDYKVVQYMGEIQPATGIEGAPIVHSFTAGLLRTVKNRFGGKLPDANNGFYIKSAVTPGDPGVSLHGVGLAIDYFPSFLPMITDARLVALVNLAVGEKPDTTESKDAHRVKVKLDSDLIGKNASATLDGEETKRAKKMFETLEEEWKRVTKASHQMQDALKRGPAGDPTEELKTLEKRATAATRVLEATHKQAPSDEEIAKAKSELQAVKERLPILFKPWLDAIKAKLAELEEREKKIGPAAKVVADLPALEARVKKAPSLRRALPKKEQVLDKEDPKISDAFEQVDALGRDLDAALATVDPDAKVADGATEAQKLAAIKKAMADKKLDAKSIANASELKTTLVALDKALTEDVTFALGVNINKDKRGNVSVDGKDRAKDPGASQLVRKGYASTDDADQQGGAKAMVARFTRAFVAIMLEQGFWNAGAGWNPNSPTTDTMHFEVVETLRPVKFGPKKGDPNHPRGK